MDLPPLRDAPSRPGGFLKGPARAALPQRPGKSEVYRSAAATFDCWRMSGKWRGVTAYLTEIFFVLSQTTAAPSRRIAKDMP